tara:strand:+ start:399 stop:722 length:324 start_codon:yes stop_codon:yes gene_type:complete
VITNTPTTKKNFFNINAIFLIVILSSNIRSKKIKIIPTFLLHQPTIKHNNKTRNKTLPKTTNIKTLLNNIRNELIKTNDIHLINFEKNIKDKELKLLFDIIQNRKTK